MDRGAPVGHSHRISWSQMTEHSFQPHRLFSLQRVQDCSDRWTLLPSFSKMFPNPHHIWFRFWACDPVLIWMMSLGAFCFFAYRHEDKNEMNLKVSSCCNDEIIAGEGREKQSWRLATNWKPHSQTQLPSCRRCRWHVSKRSQGGWEMGRSREGQEAQQPGEIGTRRGSADHGQYSDKALFILVNRVDLLSP